MSDDIEKLGLLIHDSARLMRRRFDARASAHGLSSAQWRLLVRVAKEPGIAQARIAELLEIEPISVSRLVDRMEDSGWIERRPDPADRRVRYMASILADCCLRQVTILPAFGTGMAARAFSV